MGCSWVGAALSVLFVSSPRLKIDLNAAALYMSRRLNQDEERDQTVQVAVDNCHVLLIICNAGRGGFSDTVCRTI